MYLEYPRAYYSATCIWVMHVASIGSLDTSPAVGKNDSSLPASFYSTVCRRPFTFRWLTPNCVTKDIIQFVSLT